MQNKTSIRRITAIMLSILLVLGVVAPIAFIMKASATPEELPLTYIGNRENCKMSREMADAYIRAIESVPGEDVRAALVDVADDGMPILVTASCYSDDYSAYAEDYAVWVWDGTDATAYSFPDCAQTASGYCFGYFEGTPMFYTEDTINSVGCDVEYCIYRISNANLSLMHKYEGIAVPVDPMQDLYRYDYYKDGTPISQDTFEQDKEKTDIRYTPFIIGTAMVELKDEMTAKYHVIQHLQYTLVETAPPPEASADSFAEEEKAPSDIGANVTPDYDIIPTFKTAEDITDYILHSLLYAVDFDVNDAAVNEIILFSESAIGHMYSKKIRTFGNQISIGSRLSGVLKKANETKDTVEQFLTEQGLPLNNPVDVVVPVLWENCKPEKKCTVAITEKTSQMLEDVELRLYLGDTQHYLQFDYDNTNYPVEYTFLKGNNNTYEIRCESTDGESAFPYYLCVGVPAVSQTCTVMETYNGETRNIGRQYDAASSVVFFETKTGGQYQVTDNYVQIDDIAHLPMETQNAIRYLVSGNYIDMSGTEFGPADAWNRYQFAKALVNMFFAWRDDLTEAFPDVPADHEYFHYIASGKHENIIEGYDDGLYHGDDHMTMEQMLSLAARTLVNKKQYTYPDDETAILEKATIDGTVSPWAQEAVAMALRDGLWDYDETLSPQSPITKEQAALVMYRLFLLLQEVSPLTVDTAGNVLMIAGVIASVVIVVCVVSIVILIRKHKQINKRKKGNKNQ